MLSWSTEGYKCVALLSHAFQAEAAACRTRTQQAAAKGAHLPVKGPPAPTKDQAAAVPKVRVAAAGSHNNNKVMLHLRLHAT